jgi:hypothetical protein
MKGSVRIEVFYKPELHEKMEKIKQRIVDDVIGAGAIPEVHLAFDTNPASRYLAKTGYNNIGNDSESVLLRYTFIEPDLKKLSDDEWAEAVRELSAAEEKAEISLTAIVRSIK